MKRWTGGATAEPGFYWSPRRWEIVAADAGEPLPGGSDESYRRLPAAVALALAPVMGGAFAMFLPVAGFVMLASELTQRAARAVRRAPR